MCQFFSAIVIKDDILYNLLNDSHESIVDEYELDDRTMSPDFVRVEYIPVDDNIFNHDVKNWKLKIDQDILPNWFDKEKSENDVKELFFKVIIPEIFLIDDRKDTEIRNKKIFMKNSTAKLFGNSIAKLFGDSSVILNDNSSARLFNDSIAKLHDKSYAILCDDSSAKLHDKSYAVLFDDSTVTLYDRSSAELYDKSYAILFDKSSARLFGDSSAVLYDKSTVKDYRNNS